MTKEEYINKLNKDLSKKEENLNRLIKSIESKKNTLNKKREKINKEIITLNTLHAEYAPISMVSIYDNGIRSGSDKLYKLCNQVSITGWQNVELELSFLTHKTGKITWDKKFKCMARLDSHFYSKDPINIGIYDWTNFISNFEQKDILNSKIIKILSKELLRISNNSKIPINISNDSYLKENWEAVLLLT